MKSTIMGALWLVWFAAETFFVSTTFLDVRRRR